MSIRIFEGQNHANIYSRFRPTAPQNVIEVVLQYLKTNIPPKDWQTVVDVGCGSGQGTNLLAKYFQKCYGFDVSPAQIKEAKESKHSDNVFYEASPAESLPSIQSNSVQLVTSFEAAHWFDLDSFFQECDRIVVENGVLSLIGYWQAEPNGANSPEHNSLLKLVNNAIHDPRLAPFKNQKLVYLDNHYQDLQFPNNYEFTHKDNILVSYKWMAEDLIGYIESWSAYQGLVDKDKHSAQLFIKEFEQNLKGILGTDILSGRELTFSIVFFIAMGRKISDNNNN